FPPRLGFRRLSEPEELPLQALRLLQHFAGFRPHPGVRVTCGHGNNLERACPISWDGAGAIKRAREAAAAGRWGPGSGPLARWSLARGKHRERRNSFVALRGFTYHHEKSRNQQSPCPSTPSTLR